METTRNQLPSPVQQYIHRLSHQLQLQPYYYGSVQRLDYFPGLSDVDIAYFTDNVSSSLSTLSYALDVKVSDIKGFLTLLSSDKTGKKQMIRGHKIGVFEPETNVYIEISLFQEKDKDIVLEYKNKDIHLPLYIVYTFMILKCISYYTIFLPLPVFNQIKNQILNQYHGNHSTLFVKMS
jgi:hypothetical protein